MWEESSTNLRRGGRSGTGSGTGSGSASDPNTPSAEQPPATATWNLPGDLGRRYASVSGDINPIHMHPLSARLFGFPSAIAHGMWTKARCLAAINDGFAEGGYKQSGIGRLRGPLAIIEFQEAKTVVHAVPALQPRPCK